MAPSSSPHSLYPTDGNCTSGYDHSLSELVSHGDHDEAFLHIYYLMLYVCLIWIIGKLFSKVGMPELVGQIVSGMIFGPYGLNLVGDHGSEFLIVIGEIGLIMLVVEAGLDVDIGMLKLIGPRGLMVAVFGSMLPLLMGFVIATFFGEGINSSLAIGACFAPTSMGIALNVLKSAKILNTPVGQLIIAAAILDDVIALMLLSELQAMADPTVINILLPLIVSPVLIIIFGYLAIKTVPRVIKLLMNKIAQKYHEGCILFMLFAATFMLVPGCHYAGSSHLLGAFLAGLMFCTDHTIHHTWNEQVKRVLSWMLKIFFACTIGFAIPVNEFASGPVLIKGFIYVIPIIGKIMTGIFAQPQKAKQFFTISFSMSAWGEFAFILATASYEGGAFTRDTYSSVLLAVMISVIISPYLLRLTLSYFGKKEKKALDDKLKELGTDAGHPVYYAIITKAYGSWGHQTKLLKTIYNSKLEIIDFRSWHAPEYNYTHHKPLTKESFYVQDTDLILPPTKYLRPEQKMELKKRVKSIKSDIKASLGTDSSVVIKRWLPGLNKSDDHFDPRKRSMSNQKARRPSYCRRQAFKQAHSIMSLGNLQEALETEMKQNDYGKEVALKRGNHNKGKMAKKTSHDKHEHFTGSGHDGQTGGVGVLPIRSSIINIHSHLNGDHSDDESTSYIYGDEDAEHHELPLYTDEVEFSKSGTGTKNATGHQNKSSKNDVELVLPDDGYVYNDGKSTNNKTGKMLVSHLKMQAIPDHSPNPTPVGKPNNDINDSIQVKTWNNDDDDEDINTDQDFDDQSKASDLSKNADDNNETTKLNSNNSNNDDDEDVQIVYKTEG